MCLIVCGPIPFGADAFKLAPRILWFAAAAGERTNRKVPQRGWTYAETQHCIYNGTKEGSDRFGTMVVLWLGKL